MSAYLHATIEMTQPHPDAIDVEDMLHALVPMLRLVAGEQILLARLE